MKRIYTTAVALLTIFTATTAFGQDEEIRKTFTIGPAVGFGHTRIGNVGYDEYFKPSWNAGVTMNYSKWENVGLSADILYSAEGGKFHTNQGSEIEVDLNYLRVPLKFAYFFGDVANAFRPKITIGPSFGFLISDELEKDDAAPNPNLSNSEDYETFDLGGQASLGFNYKMAERVWLNTDLYYYYGFLEIDQLNHYNNNFGLRVGVAFGL